MNANQKVWPSPRARWTVILKTVVETTVFCEIEYWKIQGDKAKARELQLTESLSLQLF